MRDNQQATRESALWQRATLAMVDMPRISELFDDITSVHPSDLGDALREKLKIIEEGAPERPLIDMLVAILHMYETLLKAKPFGPKFAMANGSRSAAPEDFVGPLVEVIVAVRGRINHPVACARLAHLAWFLERRRRDEGLAALHAYIDILECLDSGQLESRYDEGILGATGQNLLIIAFGLCQGLGRPATEHERLRTITDDLLRRAVAGEDDLVVQRFSELALDERVMPPEDAAKAIEAFIACTDSASNTRQHYLTAEMWLLAARAYKQAKNQIAEHAAVIRAAECYATQAETFVGKMQGAMMAAHWMELAIATLHGVPNVRERRQNFRHRLVDMQGAIGEDLIPITHSTDITELVAKIYEQFLGLPLSEALRQLTILPIGFPDPKKLIEDAKNTSAKFPFSSVFGTLHIDFEGKTIARSSEIGLSVDEISAENLEPAIMRDESIRRGLSAQGCIDVARTVIMVEHRVSEDVLLKLIRHSPSIPLHLVHTTTKGFARWFEGDMVSALYILTPMLEGILRHLLKQYGHDVTTMDDATKTQEDRTITGLYDAMRPEMDEILGREFTEDIRRTFLSKLGPCLRHGVAHALLTDNKPYSDDTTYACWLIWVIVIWPLLPHWDELIGKDFADLLP